MSVYKDTTNDDLFTSLLLEKVRDTISRRIKEAAEKIIAEEIEDVLIEAKASFEASVKTFVTHHDNSRTVVYNLKFEDKS